MKHPEQVREYILNNYKGMSYKHMSENVAKKFGYAMTIRQVQTFYNNNHLNSGLDGRFKKGMIPHNKGKKREEYTSKESIKKIQMTQFKKGHRPNNKCLVGEIKEDSDGYLFVKVNDKQNVPRKENWMSMGRYLYQIYNSVKISEEDKVIFLDHDKKNFARDNLCLVSKKESLYMNRNNLATTNPEITMTGVRLAKMVCAMKNKQNAG